MQRYQPLCGLSRGARGSGIVSLMPLPRGAVRVVALLMLACGACDDASATRSPAERPREAPPVTAPAPSAPPAQGPPLAERAGADDERAALDAYRAAIVAYNRRDRDAYFASFAETLSCYYGRSAVPLDRLRRSRLRDGERGVLAAARLSILARSPDEVALLDRGFFSQEPGGGREVLHEKIVILRRDGDRFRIDAETTFAERGCLGDRVPASAAPSSELEACRASHRACMTACACETQDDACRRCRLGCESSAMRCLGLGGDRADGAAPAVTPVRLTSEAEVRRFVELALREAESAVSGGGTYGDLSSEDARWLAAAELGLGAPRWRRSSQEDGVSCGWLLVGPQAAETLEDLAELRCTPALDRCVAFVRTTDYAAPPPRPAMVELHLLFDEGRLRVAHVSAPREPGIDPAALDRFAGERHPAWDAPCERGLVALLEDRAGEDFFRVISHSTEEEGDYAVERLCGARALAAVRALGDRWDCSDTGCSVLYPCGNYCEVITLDAAGRVLSYGEGIDAMGVGAASAAALRARVACGATARITMEEMYELEE